MARGIAARPAACAEHPHRDATDHCDRCGRRFCADCLVRGLPQLLCRACWDEEPRRAARAARRAHPVYGRLDALRERRASVVAAASIAVVLALLAASAAGQVLSPAYREQVGEAVSAVRRGAPAPSAPPAPPAPGTPAAAAASGGAMPRVPTLVLPFFGSATGIAEHAPGSNPAALVDGQIGAGAPVWRTPPGFASADVRVRVRDTAPAARVLFAHSAAAPRETWARDVEMWVSLRPDWTEEIRVGAWALAAATEPQEFAMPATRVASARLRILSNHGGAAETTLAEFALLSAGS